MAGGGIKRGVTLRRDRRAGLLHRRGTRSTVHDLQATILHLLGLDAWKLTYPYQGLQQRLIGPEGEAKVRREILA